MFRHDPLAAQGHIVPSPVAVSLALPTPLASLDMLGIVPYHVKRELFPKR